MMNGPIDMSGERVNMPPTDGLQVIPETACTSMIIEPGTLRCAACNYPVRWNLGDWTHEWPVAK